MLSMMDTPSAFTSPVNVGNPSEFTMLELAEQVIRIVGGPSRVAFHALPADDPKHRRPDITMAQHELGWAPEVTLEDCLKETIACSRTLLKA
jgi:UDP-glucuronate decarboxylase